MACMRRALAENAESLRNAGNLHAHTIQPKQDIQTVLILTKKRSNAMDNIITASEHFFAAGAVLIENFGNR